MTDPAADEDKVRSIFSASIEDAMNAYKGTAYNLGAKTGANGIDCSGFACKALTNAFANLRRDGIATPG
ncbi:MAG TPA: hypothetical protein VL625_00045, partial [Patescibacteria group bacterium]|nr:hypothetical protein [Patescibacteria group bacterium]